MLALQAVAFQYMTALLASVVLFLEPASSAADAQLSIERFRNGRGLLHRVSRTMSAIFLTAPAIRRRRALFSTEPLDRMRSNESAAGTKASGAHCTQSGVRI